MPYVGSSAQGVSTSSGMASGTFGRRPLTPSGHHAQKTEVAIMAQTDNELLTQLNVAMIRLDGRLDNILELLRDLRSSHQDHEMRIRVIEPAYVSRSTLRELEDALNIRIKEVYDKPTVSPATLWKVAGLLATVAGLFWGIIAFVIQLLR